MRLSGQQPQRQPMPQAPPRTRIAPLWPTMVRDGLRLGQPGTLLDPYWNRRATPAPPPVLPPVLVAPPVARPTVAPQQVTPTPRPVAPTPPEPKAPVLNLPGIRAGRPLQIANGSSYDGFSFSGTAAINAYDGKNLALTINVSAMGGFVHKVVHLSFQAQPDGTVIAHADAGPATTVLQVVSSQPGRTALKAPDGGTVLLQSTANGGLDINYGQSRIVLAP